MPSHIPIDLFLLVLFASLIEAQIGFGSTLLITAIGSTWYETEDLLRITVPINLAMNIFLTLRFAKEINIRFLFEKLLPWSALGFVLAFCLDFFFQSFVYQALTIQFIFGSILLVQAMVHLISTRPLRLGKWENINPILGGFIQSTHGSGGPWMVAITANQLPARQVRSTLQALWIILNLALIFRLSLKTGWSSYHFQLSLWLSVAMAAGATISLWFRGRIQVEKLTRWVWLLLAFAALRLLYPLQQFL